MKEFFKNCFQGFSMALADSVPGVSGGPEYSVFVILHHNWILSAFLFLPDNSFLRFCCFFYYLWLYFSTYSARSKHPFFLLVKKFARLTHT